MKRLTLILLLCLPLTSSAFFGLTKSDARLYAEEHCKDIVEVFPNEKKLCIQAQENSYLHKEQDAPIQKLQDEFKEKKDAILAEAMQEIAKIESGYNIKIEKYTNKQQEYEQANEEIREKISAAHDLLDERRSQNLGLFNVKKSQESFSGSAIIEGFMNYARSLAVEKTPYRLGAKGQDSHIDCSGLIAKYGVDNGIYTNDELMYKLSARGLYNRSQYKKDIGDVIRGDIIYFSPMKKGLANHIAVVTRVESNWGDTMNIQIIDASYDYGVSKRTIEVKYVEDHRQYVTKDGYQFKIYGGSNPLLAGKSNEKTTSSVSIADPTAPVDRLGEFRVTRYDPSRGGINCGLSGNCGHFADGGSISKELSKKVVACPYPNGVLYKDDYRTFYKASPKNPYYDPTTGRYPKVPKNPWIGKTFFIEGYGEVICKDVGGVITLAGQTNIRGNVAKYNHLDLFLMGSDFKDPNNELGYREVSMLK